MRKKTRGKIEKEKQQSIKGLIIKIKINGNGNAVVVVVSRKMLL